MSIMVQEVELEVMAEALEARVYMIGTWYYFGKYAFYHQYRAHGIYGYFAL